MKHASGAELVTQLLSRSQPEVSDSDPKPIFITKDVLRLEVTVIDTERVAIFNCV